MMRIIGLCLAALACAPVAAADLFGGIFAHDVNTPFTSNIHEGGRDFEFGYRWNRIVGLGPIVGPAPYAFVSVNDAGDTSLAAAGLSWKIGGPIYLRPGIGLAIHDGPSRRIDRAGERTDLGSRILFEPEVGLGVRLLPRVAIEASWVHVSHAQLFSRQNPGIDMIGARLNLHLP
jgi:lipid A 3-O-deacylase